MTIPQPNGDMRSDEGDDASDTRLAVARHFAEAISTAGKNMTRREQGRLVSAISALTRAELRLPYRRAA
jgi:hypothetical protein